MLSTVIKIIKEKLNFKIFFDGYYSLLIATINLFFLVLFFSNNYLPKVINNKK